MFPVVSNKDGVTDERTECSLDVIFYGDRSDVLSS